MRYVPLRMGLGKERNGRTGDFEVVVNVENPTDYAVEKLSLEWCFNYDDPLNENYGKSSVSCEFIQVGDGPLLPGETRQFVFPADQFAAMRSVVDALSPERYRIRIGFDDTTETAIEGPAFGAWVQQHFD